MSAPRPALIAFHMVVPEIVPSYNHNIAVVTTSTAERLELSRRGVLRHRFSVSVGADDAQEAVQLLQKNTFGRDLVIVTECAELERAAREKSVETIHPTAFCFQNFNLK